MQFEWHVFHLILGWYVARSTWFGTRDVGVFDDFGDINVEAPSASAVHYAKQEH